MHQFLFTAQFEELFPQAQECQTKQLEYVVRFYKKY